MIVNDRGVQAARWASAFTALGFIGLVLRLWTRFTIIKSPGWEDLVLIIAWGAGTVMTIAVGLQTRHGLGAHVQDIDGRDTEMMLFYLYLSIITYCASLGLVKVAILMMYRRLFTMRKLGTFCRYLAFVLFLYTAVNVGGSTFTCIPIRASWTREPGARCVSNTQSWLITAVTNIILDLVIVILPMPMVRRMNLPAREKLLLAGIFALGGVVTIVSIIRLDSLMIMARSSDPTYDNATVAVISVVEVQVALICSCLATLRPLLSKCVPGLDSRHGAGSHSQWDRSILSVPEGAPAFTGRSDDEETLRSASTYTNPGMKVLVGAYRKEERLFRWSQRNI
ncbi:unnamed protein product [Periconia digitata]|uniref:Rhodopsin domain-containing protein n=1 Tax=Periconia digitata TaxID=1303443 RepID=A0A9W4UG80_9PLEO|nr:unnamed protein product [Periconia digitata]